MIKLKIKVSAELGSSLKSFVRGESSSRLIQVVGSRNQFHVDAGLFFLLTRSASEATCTPWLMAHPIFNANNSTFILMLQIPPETLCPSSLMLHLEKVICF